MKNTKTIIIAIIFLAIGVIAGKTFFSGKTGENTENTVQTAAQAKHWTCSMHPQIDLPEPGQCPICGMDLIPKDNEDNTVSGPRVFTMPEDAVELANIQTFTVGEGAYKGDNSSIKLSGKIRENEDKIAVQTAHFGGRIEKLYYKSEGEYIKKGSLLALIYSPELVTAQNELIQALEVKEEQPELYNSVRKKLLNWKLTEEQVNKIERTKGIITNFEMYASVNGTITKKYVEEGDHVSEGSKMFEVLGLETVWAEFDVFERDIANIKKGTPVIITSTAYPGKKIKAKIDFIDPLLDPTTRTVKVRAILRNPQYKLKPGMIVYGDIDINSRVKPAETRIIIPKSAVLWTGKRSIVYVKPDPQKPAFELREVELGKDLGDSYEILSGLNPGEIVVTNGTFTIDAAAQLQGKASMMNVDDKSEEAKMKSEEAKAMPRVMKQSGKYRGAKSEEAKVKSEEAKAKKEMKCGGGMKCAPGKCGSAKTKGKSEKAKAKSEEDKTKKEMKCGGGMKCAPGKCGG